MTAPSRRIPYTVASLISYRFSTYGDFFWDGLGWRGSGQKAITQLGPAHTIPYTHKTTGAHIEPLILTFQINQAVMRRSAGLEVHQLMFTITDEHDSTSTRQIPHLIVGHKPTIQTPLTTHAITTIAPIVVAALEVHGDYLGFHSAALC